MPERPSALDLVEGYQLAHAVAALHDLGALQSLERPATAAELARRHGLDATLLRGVLEYVAARTDLVRRSGDTFVATRHCSSGARFLLDLYLGAYGKNAARLAQLLREPTRAPGVVDRVRYARAFDRLGGAALGMLPELVRRLDLDRVLDLGCGPAALLVDLARADDRFVGWGIDRNRAACKAARARIRAARLGRRLQVFAGDCFDLHSVLPAEVRGAVGAITASNVANEAFAEGSARAVAWLRRLRKMFPGRPLLVADYYGRLGRSKGRISRETALHDYAQLISGQGVPPSGAAEWGAIYSRAGCMLIHVIEDRSTTRFIHVVRL